MTANEIDETMKWIYAVKAKIHDEIKDLTAEEMVDYFREHTRALIERTGIQFREPAKKKEDDN